MGISEFIRQVTAGKVLDSLISEYSPRPRLDDIARSITKQSDDARPRFRLWPPRPLPRFVYHWPTPEVPDGNPPAAADPPHG